MEFLLAEPNCGSRLAEIMTVREHSYFEGNSANFYCQGTHWLDILLTNCELRPS